MDHQPPDALDTLVRGRTRRHKIILSPRFQYRPPPHQCIGHQLLDASDRPTQQHIGHTARHIGRATLRHIGPPKIILTPHYQYEPPPRRCIGHTTTGMHWCRSTDDMLDVPPQRRIGSPQYYTNSPFSLHPATNASPWTQCLLGHHFHYILGTPPQRHLGQSTPALLWTCCLRHSLDNSPKRRVGHATSTTIWTCQPNDALNMLPLRVQGHQLVQFLIL
jgi:hypothetical protein